MWSESRSMKETVPVPYPQVCGLAGTAALCPLLLPLPHSGPLVQGHFPQLAALPTALPSGQPRRLHVEARVCVCICPRVQVPSLLAAVGLVVPFQALRLLRGLCPHSQSEKLPFGQ